MGCDFSESGALHGVPVRAGEVAMTLRVRALREEEGHRLARMTRSQKLGAGLVRRAQIIQHAVDGLSAPGIAAKMSIGKEPGPRSAFNWDPCSPTWASRQWDSISTAVLEAPALVTGFDDVAVMSQSIQQRGCHFGIAEDARPFGEGEIGRDDNRGALV